MSHSHIRAPKPIPPTPRRRTWIEWTLGAWVFVFIALLAFGGWFFWSSDQAYITADGAILETRIAVAYSRDSQYGGHVYYRIEAHTRFDLDGNTQDRWLTASEVADSREFLSAKFDLQSKACQVYWVPGRPENAKCKLGLRHG